jgi:hypothetical protein
MKAKVRELIGRTDFFFMLNGYQLFGKDLVGERLRDGNLVMIVGGWNTRDPPVASAKSTSPASARKIGTIRLRISCEGHNKQLQFDFPDNTTGLAVQEAVATAMKLKPYEPIITFKGNAIDFNKTIKDQGYTSHTILTLSNIKNLRVNIQYSLKEGEQIFSTFIASNKVGSELKAALTRKLSILKGMDFELWNHTQELLDGNMIRTLIKDGDSLRILTSKGNVIDETIEDEDVEMEEETNLLHISWVHKGKSEQTQMTFDHKDKTGQDLKQAIEEHLAAEGIGYGDFTMKYNFHPIMPSETLVWGNSYTTLKLYWGQSYNSSNSISTIIQ